MERAAGRVEGGRATSWTGSPPCGREPQAAPRHRIRGIRGLARGLRRTRKTPRRRTQAIRRRDGFVENHARHRKTRGSHRQVIASTRGLDCCLCRRNYSFKQLGCDRITDQQANRPLLEASHFVFGHTLLVRRSRPGRGLTSLGCRIYECVARGRSETPHPETG